MTMQALILLPLIVLIAITLKTRRVPANAVIVDGDTVRVDGIDWRLTGFDAPEWNQPGGTQATAKLRRILTTERTYVLLGQPDHYGRPLATILTRHGPLSWRMIATGDAHGEGLIGGLLTIIARVLGRGVWRNRNAVTPAHWRSTRPSTRTRKHRE